jgi:hypothetical protein
MARPELYLTLLQTGMSLKLLAGLAAGFGLTLRPPQMLSGCKYIRCFFLIYTKSGIKRHLRLLANFQFPAWIRCRRDAVLFLTRMLTVEFKR